jgi:hypothetical protein
LDPFGAIGIAVIAAKEDGDLWQGEDSCCATPLGFEEARPHCAGDCRAPG